MKSFLFAAAATFCLMTAAQAAEMPFPSDEPVAVVDWPDGWKSQETDTGVDASSPDDSIYLAIDVSDTKDAGTTVTDALKYFASKGVTVDPATEQRTETKLNGADYATITWGGKDADGTVGQAEFFLQDGQRISRQRIAPMLEETPALRRKVRENRSRDDANTTLMKDFAGGVLVISGANSAAGGVLSDTGPPSRR